MGVSAHWLLEKLKPVEPHLTLVEIGFIWFYKGGGSENCLSVCMCCFCAAFCLGVAVCFYADQGRNIRTWPSLARCKKPIFSSQIQWSGKIFFSEVRIGSIWATEISTTEFSFCKEWISNNRVAVNDYAEDYFWREWIQSFHKIRHKAAWAGMGAWEKGTKR